MIDAVAILISCCLVIFVAIRAFILEFDGFFRNRSQPDNIDANAAQEHESRNTDQR